MSTVHGSITSVDICNLPKLITIIATNCKRSVQVSAGCLLINHFNVSMTKIPRAVSLSILTFLIVINMPIGMPVECHHLYAISTM